MKSIKTKILAIIGGIILIAMVVTGGFVINKIDKVIMSSESYTAKISTDNIVGNVNNYFTTYISMVQQISRDENVIKILSSGLDRTQFSESPYYKSSYNMLAKTTATDSENILSLFLASSRANLSFDGGDWVGDQDFNLSEKSYWFTNQADIDA